MADVEGSYRHHVYYCLRRRDCYFLTNLPFLLSFRTSSKASRIHEFQDAINVPDLTDDEIRTIEKEASKLHKRVWMGHVYKA